MDETRKQIAPPSRPQSQKPPQKTRANRSIHTLTRRRVFHPFRPTRRQIFRANNRASRRRRRRPRATLVFRARTPSAAVPNSLIQRYVPIYFTGTPRPLMKSLLVAPSLPIFALTCFPAN